MARESRKIRQARKRASFRRRLVIAAIDKTNSARRRQDEISPEQFELLSESAKADIRFKRKLGRGLGAEARRNAATLKAHQMRSAIEYLFMAQPLTVRLNAEQIADRLTKEADGKKADSYFPDGMPYRTSPSKFLKEVRRHLAVIRPRRRTAGAGRAP